jgi:hypothetical protein
MAISNRLRTGLLGFLLSVGAVLLAWGCDRFAAAGGPPGRGSISSLAVFAVTPVLTLYGLVASARGLLFDTPLFSKRTIIYTALLMLLVGVFPWAYTGRIVGGSPGNEGAGMLGTLIFLFVGVPGFTLAVVGLIAGWLSED